MKNHLTFLAKKWVLVCLWLSVIGQAYAYQATPIFQQEALILEKAQRELPHTGVLKQGSDGYVYVKVDDNYIHQLFPLLEAKGFHKPRSLQAPSQVGAHISVFYKEDGQAIKPIKELGQSFAFTIKGLKQVQAGKKLYIVLEVESPALEQLRTSYGLPSKLNNHEYHITLADKRLKKRRAY